MSLRAKIESAREAPQNVLQAKPPDSASPMVPPEVHSVPKDIGLFREALDRRIAIRRAELTTRSKLVKENTAHKRARAGQERSGYLASILRGVVSAHSLFPPQRQFRPGRFYRPSHNAEEALAKDLGRIAHPVVSSKVLTEAPYEPYEGLGEPPAAGRH